MIVKGIIKSIDVQGNTCVVRMPYFETAGNDEIIATATVSNSPGSYNGYKVDDVVWVAFENDQLECPVIIGKLYLGIEAERADPRGTLNVVDSKVSRTAEIPFDTKLGRNLEPGMPKTLAPYNSLNSIANNLSTAEVNIAQNDREYGNRFSVAFENIEGNRASINQTADNLSAEISDRIDADKELNSTLEQTAEKMVAKVSGYKKDENGNYILDKPEEFGWDLQSDKWTVFSQDGEILKADQDGLKVKGKIEAESGHIGKFIISDVHDCKIKDSEGKDTGKTFEASGIHSDDYITKFDDPATKRGVYVGTDGIKVGSNFSVDTSGVVTATELVLKPENVYLDEEETDPETGRPRRRNLKNRLDKGDDNTSNLISALEHRLGEGITNTELTNEIITAPYLGVNGAYISGKLLVGNKDTPKLHINIDDPTVKIGGFEVSTSGISSNKDTAKYNTSFGDSAIGDSGVYVGTDGIRLGKNFSVDPTGHIIAGSIDLTVTQDQVKDLNSTLETATNSAVTTAGTNVTNTFGLTEGGSSGKIKATKLEVDSAQITDLVTDQLAVLTTDSEGKKQPILLVNATVDNDGEITRTEGNVQIGGFSVSDAALSSGDASSQITVGTSGITLGTADSDGNSPFMVATNGDIYATKGTFTGAINATDASLTEINTLSMASNTTANFAEINATGNINTNGRVNSLSGYYFGTGTGCGFSLNDASTTYETVTVSIATKSGTLAGGGTNYRYSIVISANKALVADATFSYSEATWGSGSNMVTLPGGSATIKAGSTSVTVSKTVPNQAHFSDLKYTIMQYDGYGVSGTAVSGGNNPTKVTKFASITSNNTTIGQYVTKNDGNITLTCNSLQVDGNSVQFKLNNKYYTPVVKLNDELSTDNSPNCFWSKAVTIPSNRWQGVGLPADLIGKVIAAVVSPCATKPNRSAESDGTIVGDRPTTGAGKDIDFSGLKEKDEFEDTEIAMLETGVASGFIANCLYVDYTSSTSFVWVFNGQKDQTTINLIVAAKI